MKKVAFLAASFALPVLAFAQNGPFKEAKDLNSIVDMIKSLINVALPILVAGAVLWLAFNIVRYVVAGGEEAKAGAKTHIVWGVVGLFAIVSIWGLVGMLTTTFKTNKSVTESDVTNLTTGVLNTI